MLLRRRMKSIYSTLLASGVAVVIPSAKERAAHLNSLIFPPCSPESTPPAAPRCASRTLDWRLTDIPAAIVLSCVGVSECTLQAIDLKARPTPPQQITVLNCAHLPALVRSDLPGTLSEPSQSERGLELRLLI